MDLSATFRDGVAKDRTLERIYVVSPYVSAGFFDKLQADLSPKAVVLVVDASTPASSVADISEIFGKRLQVRYATAAKGGIVHAKLYFLEWSGPKKKSPRVHHLYWGSANATEGGFDRNAETLSRIPPTNDAIEYFNTLSEPTATVEALRLPLDGGGWISLPQIRLRSEIARATDLDSWLQRGTLLHRYQDDPSFLHFSVELRHSLPAGPLEKAIDKAGFRADGDRATLRCRYLPRGTEDSTSAGPWRAQYFVDTSLGYWTSRECYAKRQTEFVRPGASARQRELEMVRYADDDVRKAWVASFLSAVRQMATDIQRIYKTRKHFHYNGDEQHYCHLAGEQIKRDRKKAEDAWFRQRYATGHLAVDVPRFRSDAESWSRFKASWVEALAFGLGQTTNYNKIAKTLRSLGSPPYDPEELLLWLDKNWKRHAKALTTFHEAND